MDSTAASLGDPLGKLVLGVVVEQDRLDRGIESDGLEVAEARRARHLDDDQPPDRVELEAAHLGDGSELLGVQAVEVADVPVQRSDGDDGVGIEKPRSEHRSERVEVGVPVRGDDLLGTHGLILPRLRTGTLERDPVANGRRGRPEPRLVLRARRRRSSPPRS